MDATVPDMYARSGYSVAMSAAAATTSDTPAHHDAVPVHRAAAGGATQARTTLSGSIVGTSGGALSSPRLSSPPPPLPAHYRRAGTSATSSGPHTRPSDSNARPPPVPTSAAESAGASDADAQARSEQLRHIRDEVTRLAASAPRRPAAPAQQQQQPAYQQQQQYSYVSSASTFSGAASQQRLSASDATGRHQLAHASAVLGSAASSHGSGGGGGGGSSSAVVMTALSTLRARIRNLEAEKASAGKEVGRLQAALAEERARHAAQVKDLETAAQLDAARMRTTAGNLTAERGELEVKVVKLEAAATALQRDLAFAQQQARVEVEDKRAQEARAAAAEARASSLQALLEQEQAALQAQRTDAARQQAQAAERNAQLRRLVEQLQTALGTETGLRQGVEAAKRRAEAVLRGVVKINEELVASLLRGGTGSSKQGQRGGQSAAKSRRRMRLKKALTRTRDLARQVLGADVDALGAADGGDDGGELSGGDGGSGVADAGDGAPAGPVLHAPVLRERRQLRAQRERPWRGGGNPTSVARPRRSGRPKAKAKSGGRTALASGTKPKGTSKGKGGSLHQQVMAANGRRPVPFILGSSTARSQNVYGALQQALSSPAAYGADSPTRGALQPHTARQAMAGDGHHHHDDATHTAGGSRTSGDIPAWTTSAGQSRADSSAATMRPASVHASGDGTTVSVRDGGAAVGSDASVVGIPVAYGAAGVPTAAATSAVRLDHSLGPAHHPSAAGVTDVRTAADLAPANRGGSGGPERDLEGVIAGLEDEFRQLNARYSAVLAQSQRLSEVGSQSGRAGEHETYHATQAELEELVQAMQRRGEQLARLKRTYRAMTRRRSRSPMRSPDAAAKQRAALRAFRELQHQAASDGLLGAEV